MAYAIAMDKSKTLQLSFHKIVQGCVSKSILEYDAQKNWQTVINI
jgi:hypothetical protein